MGIRSDCFWTGRSQRDVEESVAVNTGAAQLLAHLCAQIDVIDPAIVAVLGAEALKAANRIERHRLPGVTKCAGKHIAWYGRILFALAHPSGLGRRNRNGELQRQDWRKLGDLLRGQELPRPS